MNQQDKNRLLDAYQKGTISSEDKRLLELAALEDTFLFQALEGSHDGNISVDTIREQLHKKVKKEHRRTLWVPAVAATLLLVSALMWWNNSSDNMIDSNQQIVQVDQSELESIINIPSEKIQPTSSESETNIQKNSTETITVGGEPTNNNVKHEIIEESEELARKNLNTYLKQKPTVVASGVKETKEIPPPH